MSAQATMAPPLAKPAAARRAFSPRKQRALALADRLAGQRDDWIARQSFFFEEDWRYLRFLVPEGRRVLDLGCGTGALLDQLKPAHGVGVDFSEAMIESRAPGTLTLPSCTATSRRSTRSRSMARSTSS